jgi:hypothetical protein
VASVFEQLRQQEQALTAEVRRLEQLLVAEKARINGRT